MNIPASPLLNDFTLGGGGQGGQATWRVKSVHGIQQVPTFCEVVMLFNEANSLRQRVA